MKSYNFQLSITSLHLHKSLLDTAASIMHSSASPTPATARIYVGSLPYKANVYDILALFSTHGFNVVEQDITFSTDPMTGRNPGYCFINVASTNEAQRAINDINGQKVIGRPIIVNHDTGRNDNRKHERRINTSTQSWRKDPGAPRTTDAISNNYAPTFDRWQRQDAEAHWTDPIDQGRRVWVGGLPRIEGHSASDESMQEVFAGFKIQAIHKVIPGPKTRRLKANVSYTFVDLESAGEVERAIRELNGKRSPWGGLLRLQKARVNKNRKVLREQFGKD